MSSLAITIPVRTPARPSFDKLRQKKLAYDKDGAVWFAVKGLGGLDDRVIVKSTGEPTYRLPDIAYHCNKMERKFDIVIDDGRHTPEANALTFKSIAPFLKPNGIYYIEDIWPIDQMTKSDLKNLGFDFKKQIAWAQKYRKNEFTKEKWTMFINTLKGYNIEKFDHRKRCKLLDSYIYKITK